MSLNVLTAIVCISPENVNFICQQFGVDDAEETNMSEDAILPEPFTNDGDGIVIAS